MVALPLGSLHQRRFITLDTLSGGRASSRQFGSFKVLQLFAVLLYMSTTTYALPESTSLPPKGAACGVSQDEAQKLLWKAIGTDDERGVEHAAECGADLDAVMGAYTPLTNAAGYGRSGVLAVLLRLGADREKKSAPWKGAPLHWAAAGMREDCVRLLLEAGASVKTLDGSGRTALHHAAYYGPVSVAKRLVAAGAEVNVRNNEGQTPLSYALLSNIPDMATYLRSVGARE